MEGKTGTTFGRVTKDLPWGTRRCLNFYFDNRLIVGTVNEADDERGYIDCFEIKGQNPDWPASLVSEPGGKAMLLNPVIDPDTRRPIIHRYYGDVRIELSPNH